MQIPIVNLKVYVRYQGYAPNHMLVIYLVAKVEEDFTQYCQSYFISSLVTSSLKKKTL